MVVYSPSVCENEVQFLFESYQRLGNHCLVTNSVVQIKCVRTSNAGSSLITVQRELMRLIILDKKFKIKNLSIIYAVCKW